MPRSRNIKPGFFKNEDLVELPYEGRLLFIGLWTLADREGRLEDRPKKIKIEVFPADSVDIDDCLSRLQEHGFIQRYERGGRRYIQIFNFIKHQQPHYKEVASAIPPPDGWEDSGTTPGGVPEATRQVVLSRDGACASCGSTDQLTLDHIVPRSRGGSHDESNLQALCRSCNSAKSNREAASSQEKSEQDENSTQARSDVEPSSAEQSGASPSDSLIPDSLIPDSKERSRSCRESADSAPLPTQGQKRKAKRFTPPTVEEVRDYCRDRENRVDPERFVDHYTANGWMVGKNKMRDWQAAVRNWEKDDNRGQANAGNQRSGQQGGRTKRVADTLDDIIRNGLEPDADAMGGGAVPQVSGPLRPPLDVGNRGH